MASKKPRAEHEEQAPEQAPDEQVPAEERDPRQTPETPLEPSQEPGVAPQDEPTEIPPGAPGDNPAEPVPPSPAQIEEAQQAEEAGQSLGEKVVDEETGPHGPVLTPHSTEALGGDGPPGPHQIEYPEEEAWERRGGNVARDGIEDVALNPPVPNSWVRIIAGEYTGRFAAYLDDYTIPDDETVKLVRVRTRDADNLILELNYSELEPTTYSGGR
jgi:hypothetical protein